MTNYKSKSCLVYDNGLFVTWAELLARDFGTVYYFSPWTSSYPKSNSLMIGKGLANVTRIESIWEVIDEVDLFVFPDVYDGRLQDYLVRKLEKRVWGSRTCEDFELDRPGSKEFCKKLGIDIGPYAVVTGIDALRSYLQRNENVYVKISATRGDMETFWSKNYVLIEPRLDALEHTLGAKKHQMRFIVEDAIDDAIEVGYDGFTIDGQYPENSMYGIEIKDKGLVMEQRPYGDLPAGLRAVNEKLAPAFEQGQFRGFWSSEVRITQDGTPWLIDPCPRAGSPPSELYQMQITNWSDIVWEGADGVLVEPEFAAKWGAELLIISEWADKGNWLTLQYPKQFQDNIKLRYCTVIDGKYYVAPQWTEFPEVGAICALGDTMDDAIKNCREIAEQVEGYYVSVYGDCLDAASDAINELDALAEQTADQEELEDAS